MVGLPSLSTSRMVNPMEYMSIILRLLSFFIESESSVTFFFIFLLESPAFSLELSWSVALNRFLELSASGVVISLSTSFSGGKLHFSTELA